MANQETADLARTQPQTDPIGDAFIHLQNAYDIEQAVAVITGLSRAENTSLVQRFLRTIPDAATAHIATPSDSPHAFLEAILFQFGFEPFDSSVADLQNLVSVYLRHECAQGRRTVIAVESTQDCGPRVLDVIQQLCAIDHDATPAALLVLTGTADLNRVLDSSPLAALAAIIHERFSTNGTTADMTQSDQELDVPAGGELQIIHEGRVLSNRALGHEQVLIGRSEYNDVSLVSRFVSRHHALLVNQEDGAYVVDLKSTNGTYVNSKRIEHQAIKNGDMISVGNYRLKYVNPARTTPAPIVDEASENFTETVVMQSLSGEPFEP